VQFLVAGQPVGKMLGVAENDGQEVVEIVRHAAGELAHGFHLLGLAELVAEVGDGGALLLERLGGVVEQGSSIRPARRPGGEAEFAR
jgi:hypothetical protein